VEGALHDAHGGPGHATARTQLAGVALSSKDKTGQRRRRRRRRRWRFQAATARCRHSAAQAGACHVIGQLGHVTVRPRRLHDYTPFDDDRARTVSGQPAAWRLSDRRT